MVQREVEVSQAEFDAVMRPKPEPPPPEPVFTRPSLAPEIIEDIEIPETQKFAEQKAQIEDATRIANDEQSKIDAAKAELATIQAQAKASPKSFDLEAVNAFRLRISSAQRKLNEFKTSINTVGTNVREASKDFIAFGGLTLAGEARLASPEGQALSQTIGEARGADIAKSALLQEKEEIVVRSEAELKGAQEFLELQKAIGGGLTPAGEATLATPEGQARQQATEEARGAEIARSALLLDKDIVVRTEAERAGAQKFLEIQEAISGGLTEAGRKNIQRIIKEQEDAIALSGGLTQAGKEKFSTPGAINLIQGLEVARGEDIARNFLLQGKTGEVKVGTIGQQIGAEKFLMGPEAENILGKQEEQRNIARFGGLTEAGKKSQFTGGAAERRRSAQIALGADIAKTQLLKGGNIFVGTEAQQVGAELFLSSPEGQRILLEQAELIQGGLTKAGKAERATEAGRERTLLAQEAQGIDITKTALLTGGEIIVRTPAQKAGAEKFLKEQGLLAEPEPVKTTAATTIIPSPREKTFVEGFEGTITGTILTEAERQKALAASRQKEGNIIGSILAGTAGTLLEFEAGIVAAPESLFELVGGKNVPDIGGALIGSGIESVQAGEVKASAEAVFLQTNPLFAAGAVLGEIILGVGIGSAIKLGGKGLAKGAAAISKIGKGTKVGKITEAPIKVVERFGIGGSKGEKLTTITQKGTITQVKLGARTVDIVTAIEAKQVKLTFREADLLKKFGKKVDVVGVEAFGKQMKGVKVGAEGLAETDKGIFKFFGVGITKRITGAKKFKVKGGLEDIKIRRTKLQDEIIDVATDVTPDFKSRKAGFGRALDKFKVIETKPQPIKKGVKIKPLKGITVVNEKVRFSKALDKFSDITVVDKRKIFKESLESFKTIKISPKKGSIKKLSLLEEPKISTSLKITGKTKKISSETKKARLLNLLNPLSKPKKVPKLSRTTITTKGKIVGGEGIEDMIRVGRKGRVTSIISREIKEGDPVIQLAPTRKFKVPKDIVVKKKPPSEVMKGIRLDPTKPIKPLKPSGIGKIGGKAKKGTPTKTITTTKIKTPKISSKLKTILPKSVKRVGFGPKGGLAVTGIGRVGAAKISPVIKETPKIGVTTEVTRRPVVTPSVTPKIISSVSPGGRITTEKKPGVKVTRQPLLGIAPKITPGTTVKDISGIKLRPKPKTKPLISTLIAPSITPSKLPVVLPTRLPSRVKTPVITPTITPTFDVDISPEIRRKPLILERSLVRIKPLIRAGEEETVTTRPLGFPGFGRTPVKRRVGLLFPKQDKKRRRKFGDDRFGRKRFVNPLATGAQVLGIGGRGKRRKNNGFRFKF